MRSGAIVRALLLAMATGCGLLRTVECGPLDDQACAEVVRDIESVVARSHPGRSIQSIQILDARGQARVVLDDGREIGWGERLTSS